MINRLLLLLLVTITISCEIEKRPEVKTQETTTDTQAIKPFAAAPLAEDTVSQPKLQDYKRVRDTFQVISAHPIYLMEDPALKSKRVAIIMPGEKVSSFDQLITYPEIPLQDEATGELLCGAWISVNYKDIQGYVINSYLNYPEDQPVDTLDWHLLLEGSDCNNYLLYKSTFNYYGVYKDKEGCTLRKTVFNHYTGGCYDPQSTLNYTTITKGDLKPLFIFGSSLKLTEGKLSSNVPDSMYSEERFFESLFIPAENLTVKSSDGLLEFEKTGPKTRIKQKEGVDIQLKLMWAGDLDQDGKTDFLFSYYEGYELYLSSQAGKDKVVKSVVYRARGKCC